MQHEPHLSTVFVYGSLMHGLALHGALDDCPYLGEAELFGYSLYDLGPFPGIRATPGQGRVLGELYAVAQADLDRLDAIEGEGHLYRRTLVTTLCESGEVTAAETYVYLGPDGKLLPSGTRWGS